MSRGSGGRGLQHLLGAGCPACGIRSGTSSAMGLGKGSVLPASPGMVPLRKLRVIHVDPSTSAESAIGPHVGPNLPACRGLLKIQDPSAGSIFSKVKAEATGAHLFLGSTSMPWFLPTSSLQSSDGHTLASASQLGLSSVGCSDAWASWIVTKPQGLHN